LAKTLIFDTTPLIYMIKVSLTESLRKLRDPKILPQGVYDELLKGEPLGKSESSVIHELVDDSAVKVTREIDASLVRRLIRLTADDEGKPLHRAEAEALALAKELGGVVISDDHAARSAARIVQVELHGTGYLLGRTYQEGQISKEEVIKKVGEMRRLGWRLSEDDYHAILEHLRTI